MQYLSRFNYLLSYFIDLICEKTLWNLAVWNNHRNILANLNHVFDVCNHEPEPKFRAWAYLPIYVLEKHIAIWQFLWMHLNKPVSHRIFCEKTCFNSKVTNRICLIQLTAQQLMQTMSSPRQPMIPIDVSWRGGAQKRASDYTIEPDDGFG